jgi:hypothetical protein
LPPAGPIPTYRRKLFRLMVLYRFHFKNPYTQKTLKKKKERIDFIRVSAVVLIVETDLLFVLGIEVMEC